MNLLHTAAHFAMDTVSVTIGASLLAIDGERIVRAAVSKAEPTWMRTAAWVVLIGMTAVASLAAKSWAMKGAALAIAGVLFAMGGEA